MGLFRCRLAIRSFEAAALPPNFACRTVADAKNGFAAARRVVLFRGCAVGALVVAVAWAWSSPSSRELCSSSMT